MGTIQITKWKCDGCGIIRDGAPVAEGSWEAEVRHVGQHGDSQSFVDLRDICLDCQGEITQMVERINMRAQAVKQGAIT